MRIVVILGAGQWDRLEVDNEVRLLRRGDEELDFPGGGVDRKERMIYKYIKRREEPGWLSIRPWLSS